jgi:glycosyltransferase involved in cell wall biosynthesis
MRAPAVSVIMATFNGSATVRESIDSILSQSFTDFELIVVDDGSSDNTAFILESIGDPRLRLIRNATNLGIVGSRNRAFEAAQGALIAMLDHDDLSAPERLARQVAYMEAHPETALIATAAEILQDGRRFPTKHPAVTTPGLIAWLLHVDNPLLCSSVMFRAEAVRQLGAFMRQDYVYADDYDFFCRIATVGAVARLDETLTLYRVYAGNTFKKHEAAMAENAARALAPFYARLFGEEAVETAALIVRHFSGRHPAPDEATLVRLCQVFDRVNAHFLARAEGDAVTCDLLERHAAVLWRRVLQTTAREGGVAAAVLQRVRPAGIRLSAWERARLWAEGLGARRAVKRVLGR